MPTTVSLATPQSMRPPLRIAHRGMPRAIRENTLPGFALAIDAGAEGIELDVHATKDGEVVVHHDPDLRDGSLISDLRLVELRAAALPYVIPTLGDVCDLVAGRVELFVEIKGAGIEEKVASALSGYDGPVAIHSFDHAMIRRLGERGAPCRLGILIEGGSVDARSLMNETHALDVWPHHSLVTAVLVDAVHGAGGRVIPWTVNDAGDIRRVTRLKVDGICTDDVALLSSP